MWSHTHTHKNEDNLYIVIWRVHQGILLSENWKVENSYNMLPFVYGKKSKNLYVSYIYKTTITTKQRNYKSEIDKSSHLTGNTLGDAWRGKRQMKTFLYIPF